MSTADDPSSGWIKSTFSAQDACVEVAGFGDGRTGLRNSRSPDGGAVLLRRSAFSALVAGIKAGELDHFLDP